MYCSSEATLYKKNSTEFQDRYLKFVSHKVLHWRICYFKLHFFFFQSFFLCVCVCRVFAIVVIHPHEFTRLISLTVWWNFAHATIFLLDHAWMQAWTHCPLSIRKLQSLLPKCLVGGCYFHDPGSLCLQKIWQSPYLNVKNNNNNVLRCLAFVKLRLTFSISIYMMLLYFVCSALWDVG